ncbi:MAG: hypothetical protein KBA66_17685 [Leptospiraceae bacterium]|nr:hypothetical protein [Leptospiraceae bacterium]
MKYILLLFITFPIFTQSINNSKPTPADTIDNSKLTVKEGKDSSQPNQNEESEDNSNLTQAEIRKKRKWELGLGYGESNQDFSPTPGIMNLNLEYNWTSRFSIGYTHLHERSFSTQFNVNASILGYVGMIENTNTLEVGLLNFRYYLFEKFPLYITGGWGRDWIGRDKVVDYQYGYFSRNGLIQNSPLIRERITMPSEYRFYGLGFQWVFQNGFFIGLEYNRMHSRYTNKGNSIILDKNYRAEGILSEAIFFSSDYRDEIDTGFKNIKLGYSFQF